MTITTSFLCMLAKLLSGSTVRWIDCQPDTCQRVYFANHTSHLDAIVLWSSLPKDVRAVTRAVAAKDYWDQGAVRRYIAKCFNTLLIDRQNIKVHRSPVQEMNRASVSGARAASAAATMLSRLSRAMRRSSGMSR